MPTKQELEEEIGRLRSELEGYEKAEEGGRLLRRIKARSLNVDCYVHGCKASFAEVRIPMPDGDHVCLCDDHLDDLNCFLGRFGIRIETEN